MSGVYVKPLYVSVTPPLSIAGQLGSAPGTSPQSTIWMYQGCEWILRKKTENYWDSESLNINFVFKRHGFIIYNVTYSSQLLLFNSFYFIKKSLKLFELYWKTFWLSFEKVAPNGFKKTEFSLKTENSNPWFFVIGQKWKFLWNGQNTWEWSYTDMLF